MKSTKTRKKQVIAFLLITEFAGCIALYGSLNNANSRIQSLTAQISEVTLQNAALEGEKMILQEKVNILSDTVNLKVQQEKRQEEEVRQSYTPTGLPFRETAFYNEQEKELDGNPIAVFYNANGIDVIASANGTVASVEEEPRTGFVVTVDHGNGYLSIYRSNSRPVVHEGDVVSSKTVLFPDGRELGYQVTENGIYVNPIELIESYG